MFYAPDGGFPKLNESTNCQTKACTNRERNSFSRLELGDVRQSCALSSASVRIRWAEATHQEPRARLRPIFEDLSGHGLTADHKLGEQLSGHAIFIG